MKEPAGVSRRFFIARETHERARKASYGKFSRNLSIFVGKIFFVYGNTRLSSRYVVLDRSLFADAAAGAGCVFGVGPVAGGALLGCAVQTEPDAGEDVAGAERDDGDPREGGRTGGTACVSRWRNLDSARLEK